MPPGTPSSSDPQVRRLARAVLMPGFVGTSAPDWLRRAVEGGLGGVCLFAPNVVDTDGVGDVAALTWHLHGMRPDVLVASDEEGGEVTRLDAARGSSWPTHGALGHVDDVAATGAVAAGIGRLCRDRGIDLALAPDVDVASDPDNPVIGLRSFGADPRLVARHAVAFVAGLQSLGVAACAKHFPGHGDTRTDSHLDLPVVDLDLETLTRRDLVPFEAVISAGVRAVMTAHIVFPAIDDRPATLSPEVLAVLRGDLGFSGLVVSDAVDMAAIARRVGRGPGAAAALAAGVDLVCIGNPHHPMPYDDEAAFHEVHGAVLAAVDSGDLRVDRLEEAARRVAELAWWVGENRAAALAVDAGPSQADARRAADHVARAALVTHDVVHLTRDVHVLDLRDAPSMAAGPGGSGVLSALARARPGLQVHPVGTSREPGRAVGAALASAADGDVVVVVGSPHRSPGAARRLAAVLGGRHDALVVATGLPDDRDRLGEHWVRTWGDTPSAGQALASLVFPAQTP
ncbi:MAG: glycoside hydrolase family 3 [Actinomycetota bacterium]|nr:glycoside hydrolase family 3 [Actinomycetota bacterium]